MQSAFSFNLILILSVLLFLPTYHPLPIREAEDTDSLQLLRSYDDALMDHS